MRNIIFLLTSLLVSYSLTAQVQGGNRPGNGSSQMTGTFYGKLIEAKTSKPIEYASVQLFQNKFIIDENDNFEWKFKA